jgi:hypothetical protein
MAGHGGSRSLRRTRQDSSDVEGPRFARSSIEPTRTAKLHVLPTRGVASRKPARTNLLESPNRMPTEMVVQRLLPGVTITGLREAG